MQSAPEPEGQADARSAGKTAAALDLGSARILIVDRDILSQRMTASILEQDGLDVVVQSERHAVMPALENYAIDVVILDVAFPDGGGRALMEEIHADRRYSDLPIVLMSSPSFHDEAMSLLDHGADDVLLKPVEPRVVIARIRSALRARRALLGMEAAHAVIAALANEMNTLDSDISHHTERIGEYASHLGRRAGLSAADQHAVAYSILLHDLGRIGISESILLKQGPLTADERKAIMRHTEIGERIAAPLPGSERFGRIIRHHHERWDGAGYPDGLISENIPTGARIISIVDAFDAMTQFRPYREPRSVPEAIDELRRERGKQFDPALVDTFVRVLEWDGMA